MASSSSVVFRQLVRTQPQGEAPRAAVLGLDPTLLPRKAPPAPVSLGSATCALADGETLWVGTVAGLLRFREGRWDYLAGPRWLLDDRVESLAAGQEGALWVGTGSGPAVLRSVPLTLARKAEVLRHDLVRRSRRWGFVAPLALPESGDPAEGRQRITDQDGLSTALHVAAESLRYAVTGDPGAREAAGVAVRALLSLEAATGIPGFPARAVAHEAEPEFAARPEGEWHASQQDSGLYWLGDTPSDEIVGHYLAYFLYCSHCAPDDLAPVRETCRRITDHILANGFRLMDCDGRPTTWGIWSPDKLNDDPAWWEERGLNSLQILSHLKVAAWLVGDPRYEEAYRALISDHNYHRNTCDAKVRDPGLVNHADDQLAFLSFYPLLLLETDPELRAVYLSALRAYWLFEAPEDCPLWNLIYGALTGGPCNLEAAIRSLEEMPLDLVDWPTRNRDRLDLDLDPNPDRFGHRQLRRPLSWLERPLHNWAGNPYCVDGGDARSEEPQTLWLLPYWLGRFHGLL
jgi:hypothetical protein